MDQKISQFPVATDILAPDYISILQSGLNKIITAGVFALNLPNFGNKGITKNNPVVASIAAIPLTSTIVVLPVAVPAYTLAAGTNGQEVTLVSRGANVVTLTGGTWTSATLTTNSTITVLYETNHWVVKSSHLATIA
jgi:hypothetical protein